MKNKELQCYSYSIKVNKKDYSHAGWIDAHSIEEAERKLYTQYGDIEKVNHLRHEGTWENFIKQGETYGWD